MYLSVLLMRNNIKQNIKILKLNKINLNLGINKVDIISDICNK